MARYVVQEMVITHGRTLWEDRNEYYDLSDAIVSCNIDRQTWPHKLFRIATTQYNV